MPRIPRELVAKRTSQKKRAQIQRTQICSLPPPIATNMEVNLRIVTLVNVEDFFFCTTVKGGGVWIHDVNTGMFQARDSLVLLPATTVPQRWLLKCLVSGPRSHVDVESQDGSRMVKVGHISKYRLKHGCSTNKSHKIIRYHQISLVSCHPKQQEPHQRNITGNLEICKIQSSSSPTFPPVPPGIPLTIGKDCCTPIWAGATVVTPIGTACCVPVACGTVMGYDAVYAPYVAVTGWLGWPLAGMGSWAPRHRAGANCGVLGSTPGSEALGIGRAWLGRTLALGEPMGDAGVMVSTDWGDLGPWELEGQICECPWSLSMTWFDWGYG